MKKNGYRLIVLLITGTMPAINYAQTESKTDKSNDDPAAIALQRAFNGIAFRKAIFGEIETDDNNGTITGITLQRAFTKKYYNYRTELMVIGGRILSEDDKSDAINVTNGLVALLPFETLLELVETIVEYDTLLTRHMAIFHSEILKNGDLNLIQLPLFEHHNSSRIRKTEYALRTLENIINHSRKKQLEIKTTEAVVKIGDMISLLSDYRRFLNTSLAKWKKINEINQVSHSNSYKELKEAVINRNIKLVAKKLSAGTFINNVDESKMSLLHHSCKEGDLDMTKLLISHGSDINLRDQFHKTPLDYAENSQIHSLLRKNGAKNSAELLLESVNQDPLYYAITTKDIELIKKQIAQGADVNGKAKHETIREREYPYLMVATITGSEMIVEYLIKNGANVNSKSRTGATSLILAAFKNSKEIVQILIANGADVNAKDNRGRTPLSAANNNKNQEISKILRENGAK
tara:strand:+ start:244 stop:1635 length:1392 start_codon:yes stop_codon:yes gene_type:complete